MKQLHILLIEDNTEIRTNITEYLELENYKISTANDGEIGLDSAISHDYDLILLDLMLPKIDGITIANKIKQKKNTPIIMITAKDAIEQKLIGFASGADDYLVKPFDLRELDVRIQSVYNRVHSSGGAVFEFESLKINLKDRVFSKGGENINITGKEFQIIEILLTHKGITISRTEIIETIWGEAGLFNSDGKLDVYISNLRSKLGKNLIQTIKGYGYRID